MSTLTDTTDALPQFTLTGVRKAKVVSCYDGDTFEAAMELGGQLWKFDCRMDGYDAPEMKPLKTVKNRESEKDAALQSKIALLSFVCDGIDASKSYTNKELDAIVKLNKRVIDLRCKDFDKYGRVLVEVPLPHIVQAAGGAGSAISESQQQTVNSWMIVHNYGYAYSGGTKKVW